MIRNIILLLLFSSSSLLAHNSVSARTEDLGNCPDFDAEKFSSSIKKAPIPKSISAASDTIAGALSQKVKENIIENNGYFTLCWPTKIFDAVSNVANDYWRINDWNKPLPREFIKLGLYKNDEMVYEILRVISLRGKNIKFDEVKESRSIALNHGDDHVVNQEISINCVDNGLKNISGLNVVINGYFRNMNFIECKDGSYMFYLWERGWFVPDAAMMKLTCEEGTGNLPKICKKPKQVDG